MINKQCFILVYDSVPPQKNIFRAYRQLFLASLFVYLIVMFVTHYLKNLNTKASDENFFFLVALGTSFFTSFYVTCNVCIAYSTILCIFVNKFLQPNFLDLELDKNDQQEYQSTCRQPVLSTTIRNYYYFFSELYQLFQ